MTVARAGLVKAEVTRWYHCTSKCARPTMLRGEGFEHRHEWLRNRLALLSELFAIKAVGSTIKDQVFHVLIRLELEEAEKWDGKEVAARWMRIYPPRNRSRRPIPVTEDAIEDRANDAELIATWRSRLSDLGWFMKCLKEPLARSSNREEKATGAFFRGRFRSKPILDLGSLQRVGLEMELPSDQLTGLLASCGLPTGTDKGILTTTMGSNQPSELANRTEVIPQSDTAGSSESV